MIGRDILGNADPTRAAIELILETAERMQEIGTREVKKVPTLRGRTLINLFFEPSTRTQTSFEIAGKRLAADVETWGDLMPWVAGRRVQQVLSSLISVRQLVADQEQKLVAAKPCYHCIRIAAFGY